MWNKLFYFLFLQTYSDHTLVIYAWGYFQYFNQLSASQKLKEKTLQVNTETNQQNYQVPGPR